MLPALIVICGPTATGKSALAMQIAQRLAAPILSADSRQIYQGFDIGTAKPSVADQAQVSHELIDLCLPTVTFTVAEYQSLAQTLIAKYQQQGIIPILVGGTGLYIQAITQGLKIPRVPPQPHLRTQLEALPQAERYQWLQQIDPQGVVKIHPHDQVRTLRALEVYYTTGRPLSVQQGTVPPTYPILILGLDCPDLDRHSQLIYQRTQAMLHQGWLAEVETLMQRYGAELPLLRTLGYAELRQYLLSNLSLDEAVAQIVLHTRQFAKRQRTWFRAEPAVQWLEAATTNLHQAAWQKVEVFLKANLAGSGLQDGSQGSRALLK
jgi:tRNA dimethylallyltransferase